MNRVGLVTHYFSEASNNSNSHLLTRSVFKAKNISAADTKQTLDHSTTPLFTYQNFWPVCGLIARGSK